MVSNAASPITHTMLAATRNIERRVSSGAPTASPMPRPTIGDINGEINIAPITMPVLLSTRPSVAIPVASTS